METTTLIARLGAATDDAGRFGGKAAGLGRLIELGHRVPPGVAISVDALIEAVTAMGLHDDYAALEESLRTGEPDLDLAERLHDAVEHGEVPARLADTVRGAARELAQGGRVIVRSSAAAEDSAAHSYAGIFESFPVAVEDVASAISRVWASAFAARAVTYAAHAGLGHVPHMGVVIQRFVEAERSGVMFTTFPGPDGGDDILVEHVAGTAEKLVRGEVTPSRLWLRSQLDDADLDAGHIDELRRLAGTLEGQFSGPQDVEWCVLDQQIHVVQTRPITAAAVPAAATDFGDADVLLRGTPASPGVGSGSVHLAFNVDQALALESGAVLVTPMTNPDMVVAMRNSAAIVTDVGGMICHAAIVSRELQLPCVVGTGTATETLAAGQVVTVDGGGGAVLAGEVALETSAAARVEATDLWAAWPDDAPSQVMPLVGTRELLAAAPEGLPEVAYVVDPDLRCDTRGLWRPLHDPEVIDTVLAAALEVVPATLAIHLMSAGAVTPADLAAAVARRGDQRLHVSDDLVIAGEGAALDGDARLAVPLTAHVPAGTGHRSRLGPVAESIGRSLDPSQGPGPVPQVRPAPMPDPAWRRRWWEVLPEYGRFHHEHGTADGNGVFPFIEIRPEVLTSPLLKSLVQPGFEMVPRVLGFAGLAPMHTKWARCRFHVRADTFAATWQALVESTWNAQFMEEFLERVRRSYEHLAEVVRLFPQSDEDAKRLDGGQIVALITSWWPRWVEFFALNLFIQAQGEAILYPVIAEAVEANLADLGPAPDGRAWPQLPDLVAPTTPVLSADYMTSVAAVRTELDAAGIEAVADGLRALEAGTPQSLVQAVEEHLRHWHWMRDRDLLFDPWDTAERVIETALRTEPHPPVAYEANLRQNLLALAFHAELAAVSGRAETLRHGVRFLQDLNVERENHHVLWLKYSYPLRRIVVEVERRLIDAGSPLTPGDVFYLQAPELMAAVEALPEPVPAALAELAEQRRRAYRHEAHLEPADPETLYVEDDYY